MSPSASSVTASGGGAPAPTGDATQRTRGKRPLDHLLHPSTGTSSSSGDAQSFEAALRSAASRTVDIDTATDLPVLRRAPARREVDRPQRPVDEPVRARTDPSPDRRDEPVRTERHDPDDARAASADRRGDDRVGRDDDRAQRDDRDGSGHASDRDGEDVEATTSEDSTDDEAGATGEVEVDTGGAVVVDQALTLQLDQVTRVEVDTEQEVVTDDGPDDDQAGTTTDTARGDRRVVVDLDGGEDADRATGALDRTSTEDAGDQEIDLDPTVETDRDRQRLEDGELAVAESTDGEAVDTSQRRSMIDDSTAGPVAETGARSTGHTANQQNLVLGAETVSTRPTTITRTGTVDATTPVSGLERTTGRNPVTDRFRAEATVRSAAADETGDADGPDAVWRQVRRALGSLRSRSDGEREMVVRLRPAELGSVTIRVHTTEQGVRVSLVADTAAAAGQLNQQRHHLLSELDESGLAGASVDVGQHDPSDGTGPGGGRGDGEPDRGPELRPTGGPSTATSTRAADPGRRRSSGSIDLDL
jgi:hypothetical protein